MGDSALALLQWLQGFATPWLDVIMGAITYLGTEYFYLAALCFLYWCVDMAGTMRLLILLLASTYLGGAIKEITDLPRPFQSYPDLIEARFAETAGDPSFPSNHAQNSVVFWGYLALVFQKRWLYVAAPIVTLLVAFSRLYLGLHWPRDVLLGLLFGLIILVCGYVLLRLLAGVPIKAQFPSSLLLCLVPFLLFLLFPSHTGAVSMGVIFGTTLGYLLERQHVRFAVRRPIWQQILKLLIGLSGAFLLLFGLGALFDPLLPSRESVRFSPDVVPPAFRGFLYGRGYETLSFIRYALVGLWTTLIAPALFRFLFGREEPEAGT